jgi:ABC-2 type transport system permease protein
MEVLSMTDLSNALWIELRKAARSKVPVFTLLGFLILPLACAFLMFIYKDPEFARNIGLIGAKANLAGGSADWPFYLSMFAEGIAIGGIMLFGMILSWVFGREFADGTLKDLLAVPVARGTILAAKFITAGLWSLGLAVIVYLTGLLLGALVGLPLGTPELFANGSTVVLITTCLVFIVSTPIALMASVGRGYLLPVGIAMLILAVANVVTLIGWGAYFPWAIPGIYAGFSTRVGPLEPASYLLVILTGAAGVYGTYLWWKYADQSR